MVFFNRVRGQKAQTARLVGAGRWTTWDLLIGAAMSLVIVITLYPMVYVISMSLSDPRYVISRQVYLLPREITLDSYRFVLKDQQVLLSMYNAVWYTVVGTLINVTMTTLAAYPLSREQFSLRNPIMLMITLTMFVSGGLIPAYILVSQLHLYNTRWAIVLPTAISAYNLIVTRTYFSTIPESLPESARIDGANDFVIFLKIMLPMVKPIIAVLILFYGCSRWNSYFPELLYLADRKLQPVQLYLRNVLITQQAISMQQGTGQQETYLQMEQLKYTVIVIAVMPITVLYPFLQKYFVQGVMIGAVKS